MKPNHKLKYYYSNISGNLLMGECVKCDSIFDVGKRTTHGNFIVGSHYYMGSHYKLNIEYNYCAVTDEDYKMKELLK